MLNVKTNGGLCSTCDNAPSCFHRARRGPALFCELFDNHVWPELRTVKKEASPAPPGVLEATDEDTCKYEGLCVNCDNRQTCAHPKPAGGVWHCENYC